MAGTYNFYEGGNYPLDGPSFSEYSIGLKEGEVKASSFAFTTDPRTANQIKAVSDKLNTGAKAIEVSGLSLGGAPMELMDSIPKQHFEEINRLKKLAGVDLTFHGPLIEPTGFAGRQGWTEADREQSEKQMLSAVERAHDLDPKGNLVVTFHSSSGLPEPVMKFVDEKGKEKVSNAFFVDEREGQFRSTKPISSALEGKKYETEEELNEYVKKMNKDSWDQRLQNVNFHEFQGSRIVEEVLNQFKQKGKDSKFLELYKDYKEDAEKAAANFKKEGEKQEFKEAMSKIMHGEVYLRDAFRGLQELYDEAYHYAEKKAEKGETADIDKLKRFKEEIGPKLKYINNPEKINELVDEMEKGMHVLNSISPPETLKPLKEFAIDKASETFANVAWKAFNEFDKKGQGSPIISIENPPAGGGLSRAEDLRALIEESRRKFVIKAKEEGISENQAKELAEKHIGATWDVGHINMIRKFGYGEEEVKKQTKEIAPFVKHVHLSDNFGMEHTELPMGMGNVPIKPMLEAIKEYNDKVKMVVETGGAWFRDFKVTPFKETLAAFGSPIYAMKMSPYWSQSTGKAGYYSGYGPTLPEQHFSIYGAGFSTLPVELGGQMAGRSRLSGTPSE